MSNFRHTALASVINLAMLGIPDALAADSEALERRIRELESRLAKMDQLEARLEKLDRASALPAKPSPATAQALPNSSPSPEVAKLNQKVNILERKLEVQEEVNTGAFKKLPIFEAGADGFKITSSDKKHQLRIGSTIQTDYRNFVGDNPPAWIPGSPGFYGGVGPSSIFLRQARIILDGYVFKSIYFKIMPDFAQNTNTSNLLPDAYVDFAYVPQASLLVGKYKPSIGLERLQGDTNTAFLERAFPTNLAPNRDVGIQIHGAFAMPGYKIETAPGPIDTKNAFTYQVGITDGTGDSGNAFGSGGPTNSFANNKEFDGRIFAQPFQHSGYEWLEGFGVGLSGSFSNPDHQTLQAQKTPLGQSQFIDYTSLNANTQAGARTVTANGNSNRIYPQAFWYKGPFGLMGEYVASTQTLNASGAGTSTVNNITQTNTAAQVQVSYVVTGEDNTFDGVKPLRNFDPFNGSWGALQLAARWTQLNVDSDTFKILDPTKSASKAIAGTFGANWFLNKYALIRFDYEYVSFDGGAGTSRTTGTGNKAVTTYFIANRPSEQVISTRFQLAF
ncbi:MAG: porin [Methylococcales bacterium]|nr:porin [Methylococcales bacterium]